MTTLFSFAELDAATIARAAAVRLAVFDVDGVLTTGELHYGPQGEEVKVFNTLDGHGMKMLQESGVQLAIISGRSSPALAKRAEDLGVLHLEMGVHDKRIAFERLLATCDLPQAACAGIGDDVVDLPYLTRCGFAVAVPDAPAFVRSRVHWVTRAQGGRGAVREFCEIILHARGLLDGALRRYLA